MSAYAATWPLNDFYSPEKSTSLFEAIPRRQSCRCFLSAPSTEQWNALGSAAKAYALPDVRIALGLCDTALFQPFMGLLMKFENVQRYAAIITRSTSPQSIVDAGVSGEMLMLHAVSIGLAGVWVVGTYKKNALSPCAGGWRTAGCPHSARGTRTSARCACASQAQAPFKAA
ncbi:MAG: nitroreductase family protein [Clostridia bacterium]